MVASFGSETPVLFYGPRAHANPGGRNDRVWVLWPAWAFRVIAPEFRRRPFNALQKAVLGVLRASRHTAVELGERLGIHPELAAFVVTELQNQNRVDDKWAVTRRGIELLDEEREESTSLAPGWVFRDPWNDHLWPFVAPSLEYARTAQDERDRVVLDLGTTGETLAAAGMDAASAGRTTTGDGAGHPSDPAGGAPAPAARAAAAGGRCPDR